MKVKTVIEDRFPKQEGYTSILRIGNLYLDLIFTTLIPFIFGVMFGKTKSIIFIVLIVIYMFFNIGIRIKKDSLFINIFKRF